MSAIISCRDLAQRIGKGAVVVDLMTPEDFAAGHLVGAQNACVYEMVFLDRIAECVSDREAELVIYDATGSTRAAAVAREKLLQAGYRNVSVLCGGLSAWRDAGLPVEKGEEAVLPEPAEPVGTYQIDVDNSRLEWIGRNLGKRHFGCIAVQSGELFFAGGRLSAGNIVLDMRSLSNLDLQDPAWHDLLLEHLKSEDFFAVERFPTASFRLTKWEAEYTPLSEAPGGIATGDLTIRDVTRSVRFPAIVAPQPDGSIKGQAAFDIDRTIWNVCYGSCKLFERLGMHLVHDMVSLELFVVANRS